MKASKVDDKAAVLHQHVSVSEADSATTSRKCHIKHQDFITFVVFIYSSSWMTCSATDDALKL